MFEEERGENIEEEMTVGAKEEGGEGTRGGREVEEGASEGVKIAFLDKERELLSANDSGSEDTLKEE